MRVAIAGYGMEGEASYNYYVARGDEVIILDERHELGKQAPTGSHVILGSDAFEELGSYDLVIRTPSLTPLKLNGAKKIWSATNEFFAQCRAPIVAITGTKGKGTTSSLIASILRSAGYNVHLVGNIGTAALEVLPRITENDIVVFEISSFQLWDIERSPHVAVVLMIEPDHLNIHQDFDDYIAAKAHIRMYQNKDDICIYHPSNPYSFRVAQSSAEGEMIRYSSEDKGSVHVIDGNFVCNEQIICSVDALQLVGGHNIENACAAISAASVYTADHNAIAQGLRQFTGLPHRIQFVREHADILYYNDSYSSAPAATIAALQSFSQPIVLIAGGSDKQADFSELAQTVQSRPSVTYVLLMGQTKDLMAQALDSVGFVGYEICDERSLEPIFRRAVAQATVGSVVLLSPGCASFDMFENFTDRGQQFCKLVEAL
ncbi:UDP-N-acetylmuramoyl-L-alanine--D-glutamate ligase [Candidatus Saccharibacteria bacterium]|nr:UDP-N-acetylmuramoyl-L-alanine--D-glutamate ligase [Candidatus Saccharibacteria bacterium]